jgi:hypothetical protein
MSNLLDRKKLWGRSERAISQGLAYVTLPNQDYRKLAAAYDYWVTTTNPIGCLDYLEQQSKEVVMQGQRSETSLKITTVSAVIYEVELIDHTGEIHKFRKLAEIASDGHVWEKLDSTRGIDHRRGWGPYRAPVVEAMLDALVAGR